MTIIKKTFIRIEKTLFSVKTLNSFILPLKRILFYYKNINAFLSFEILL